MKTLFTYFFLFSTFLGFSQTPSSEAISSLKSGASSGINQANGQATVMIPIYNLKEGDLEVPIYLTHSGAGIQVEEIASRTGLGSNLVAGGRITRIIRDKPDEGYVPEKPSGFSVGFNFFGLQQQWTFTPTNSYLKASHIYNLAPNFIYMGGWFYNGKPQYDSTRSNPNVFDHTPDIFVINIAGKSIRFIFDENRQIQVLNGEDVKIEYGFNYYSPNGIDSGTPTNITARGFANWTVTLSDGTQYLFGEPTTTKPSGSTYSRLYHEYSYDKASLTALNDPSLIEYSLSHMPNSWLLRKIISPVGTSGQKNEIFFNYKTANYESDYLRDYEQIHNPDNCAFPQTIVGKMRNLTSVLTSIESANIKVEFNAREVFDLKNQLSNASNIIPDYNPSRFVDTVRQDVSEIIEDVAYRFKTLKNILIRDKSTNFKKAFYFDTDYFVTQTNLNDIPQPFTKDETLYWGISPRVLSVTYNNYPNPTTDFSDYKRLRLKGVYEIQMEAGNYKLLPGHSFEYSMVELPRRLSQARDHWGYYNGKHDNRLRTNLMPVSYNTTTSCTNTSNREANIVYGKAGLLTKVFFPTGSQVTYNYEPHEATNWGLNTTIGGFRVGSIVTDDCLTGSRKEVKYEYKQADNSSSGYVSLKPKYFFKHNTTLGANSIDYIVQSVG